MQFTRRAGLHSRKELFLCGTTRPRDTCLSFTRRRHHLHDYDHSKSSSSGRTDGVAIFHKPAGQ